MSKLLVLAGANGSGKSTITARIPIFGQYVNADEIKKELGCTDMEAAIIAEATREHFLSIKTDFTFETVLSTERNLNLMKRAKSDGYYIVCIYVLTKHPDINVARVSKRVSLGGQGVIEEKIRSRYVRTMNLFPQLIPVCDELYVFDNSLDVNDGEPSLILHSYSGDVEIHPGAVWNEAMIHSLLKGNFPQEYI